MRGLRTILFLIYSALNMHLRILYINIIIISNNKIFHKYNANCYIYTVIYNGKVNLFGIAE